jgi:hypothetical protein
MAVEERASSWALSLVDVLESNEHTRTRVCVAAGAGLATIVMWVVHLTYPEVFTFFLEIDSWAKLAVGFVLAPPFLVGLGASSFIFPKSIEPASPDESGPMSSFFYQEKASRRWKLLIAAGVLAAVNFVAMFVTSGI